MPQPRPKAVLFDVNQTLFSLEPVRHLADPHQPIVSDELSTASCLLHAARIVGSTVHWSWQSDACNSRVCVCTETGVAAAE